jgi:hypothetical protein
MISPIESRTVRTIFGGANRVETQPISPPVEGSASLLITARRDAWSIPTTAAGWQQRSARVWRYRGKDISRGGHLTLIGALRLVCEF